MRPQQASSRDLGAMTETIALAFERDPVWSVALATPNGDTSHVLPFWQAFVEGGLRHGTAYVTDGAATVSVWIPPGEHELTDEKYDEVLSLMEAALGNERAAAFVQLWERFERLRPMDRPHGYLNLLATRPSHAGRGLGMAHLAADLERWDAAGLPTYLESSNPANNARYARHGYVPVDSFETVIDGAIVTTMWRPVGG